MTHDAGRMRRQSNTKPRVVIFAGDGSLERAYHHKRKWGGSAIPIAGGWSLLVDEPSPELNRLVAKAKPVPIRRDKVARNQPCSCGCGAKAKRCRGGS